MVYTGKPSKSCEACRARKRRCDKGVPGCGQCRRQGTDCPGYRDLQSLAFRNETDHVIGKAKRKSPLHRSQRQDFSASSSEGKSPASSDEWSPSSSTSSSAIVSRARQCTPPLPFQMQMDMTELGLTYFHDNYVAVHNGGYESFLTVAPKVLAAERNPEAMTSAIHAISLAGIANLAGTQLDQAGLSRRAWFKYCTALRALNEALADPVAACKDSTLFAVLLLSIFESVTCSGPASVSAWRRHINGASALIHQRGLEQFEREMGRLAFREVFVHILLLCYRESIPVPRQIRDMRLAWEKRLGPAHTIWLMSNGHMDAIDFFQRATAPDWPLPEGLCESLLVEALELDRRNLTIFREHISLSGHDFEYRTIFDPRADPELVYDGMYHVYPSTWLARMWTGTRTSRILINRLIRAMILEAREGTNFAVTGQTREQLLRATEHKLYDMGMGLIAVMPQLLGYLDQDGSVLPKEAAKTQVAGAYHAMFHLSHAGHLPVTEAPVREWATRQLRRIEAQTGIRKAGFLADVLVSEGPDKH